MNFDKPTRMNLSKKKCTLSLKTTGTSKTQFNVQIEVEPPSRAGHASQSRCGTSLSKLPGLSTAGLSELSSLSEQEE